MAPIKFEENIKDKLDKRTLRPSTEAWNKLSERLDAQENKGNKKSVWWIGLAASIVGVLFVASQFLSDKSAQEIIPKVVDAPEVKTVIKQVNNSSIADEDVIRDVDDVKTSKALEPNKTKYSPAIADKAIVAKGKVIVKENTASELKIEIEKPIAVVEKELNFEEEAIQNVVAKIEKLQDYNSEVTDEEIDALLLQAQNEITLKKLYNENTKVVDADLLLQDVEADLDQSFRTKVFETLRASYNTVKTAVAQRNN